MSTPGFPDFSMNIEVLVEGIHGQNPLRYVLSFFKERIFIMQDIIKEYGPAIITVIAIVALIGLISFLIGTDGSSVVGKAFSDLINNFFTSAGGTISAGTPSAPGVRFF